VAAAGRDDGRQQAARVSGTLTPAGALVQFLLKRQCGWRAQAASSHALALVIRGGLRLQLCASLPVGLTPRSAGSGVARVCVSTSWDGSLVAVGVPNGVTMLQGARGAGAAGGAPIGVVHDPGLGTVQSVEFQPRGGAGGVGDLVAIALSGAGSVDGTLALGCLTRRDEAGSVAAGGGGRGGGRGGGGGVGGGGGGGGGGGVGGGGSEVPTMGVHSLAWQQRAAVECRGSGVWCATWCPRGVWVAVGCAGTLSCATSRSCIVDAGTWRPVTTWRSDTDILAVGWSCLDASVVFCGGRNGSLAAVDVREGRSGAGALTAHSLSVPARLPTSFATVCGVPGTFLLACGDVAATAMLFDVRAMGRGAVASLAGYSNTHRAMAQVSCDGGGFLFAPDLAAGTGVCLWDANASGRRLPGISTPHPVLACTVSRVHAGVSKLYAVTPAGVLSSRWSPA
jgi:hypothetical protein